MAPGRAGGPGPAVAPSASPANLGEHFDIDRHHRCQVLRRPGVHHRPGQLERRTRASSSPTSSDHPWWSCNDRASPAAPWLRAILAKTPPVATDRALHGSTITSRTTTGLILRRAALLARTGHNPPGAIPSGFASTLSRRWPRRLLSVLHGSAPGARTNAVGNAVVHAAVDGHGRPSWIRNRPPGRRPRPARPRVRPAYPDRNLSAVARGQSGRTHDGVRQRQRWPGSAIWNVPPMTCARDAAVCARPRMRHIPFSTRYRQWIQNTAWQPGRSRSRGH